MASTPLTTAEHRAAAHRTTLILAFAIVYLVWGSTYLAIRYAILTIPPFLMAGTRFLIAGTIMYTWGRLRGTPRPTPRHWRNTAILGALLLLFGNGSVVWAEQSVPSGIAALLVATVPLWIVLLQWIAPHRSLGSHRVRPSLGVVAGVVVGLIGLITLVGTNSLRGQGDIPITGVAALTFGSFTWAIGSLFGRYADLPDTILATAMEMLTGGAMLMITAAVSGELHHFSLTSVSTTSILGILYLITLGSIVAYTTYTWLLTAASPALVGTYAYVNPVVAVFLGWWLANEPVTLRTLAGAAIIILAVMIITTAQKTAPPPQPIPEKTPRD